MGGKKGGGGKGKKKKEQEEKNVLTEVDRDYYELQLVDLNRKLTRLRNRSGELESANSSLSEELRSLDEDRADIIAYLKKTLNTKTDEMTELQERLDGLKQSMESSVVMYKEKISQMDQDFKNMHEELTSEIKLLMGKLNSLEEFRAHRDELLAKFANQEERMAELEKNRQQTLYDCDRNFILEKDKLKKQMETRLLQLSQQFQEATDIRIAATTHRVIKENVAINKELDIVQEVQKQMLSTFDEMKHKTAAAQLEVKLREEERDQALKKCLGQQKEINKLKKENDVLKENYKEMTEIKRQSDQYKKQYQDTKEALEDAENEIKALNKRNADGQSHSAKLYADVAALKVNGRRLYSILHKAVSAVKEALKIKENVSSADEALIFRRRDDLLLNLLELLNRATIAERERYMLSRSSTMQSYSTGDVGLIPKSD